MVGCGSHSILMTGVARGGGGCMIRFKPMGWVDDDEPAVGSSYDSWWTGTGKCGGDAIAVGWDRLVCEISSLPGHFTHFQGLRHGCSFRPPSLCTSGGGWKRCIVSHMPTITSAKIFVF